jgi:phosphatidylglycerol:prolipoprotein diacylglycerol transferase
MDGTVSLLVIEIPWSPIIFTLGGFMLTWHGLFTAIGILAGVQLSLRMGRVVGYDPDQAYTLALIGTPCGIIGARALFVAEHWDFYRANLGDILALAEGGISVWGAVLGGVGGAWLFALWRRYPVGRGLDIASFGIILGLAIGRLGDLVNGEHLGRATNLPWAVIYTNPLSPAFAHSIVVGPHHPATTYEMFADLLILGLLFVLLRGPFRTRQALTFFAFLDLYAVLRFVLTYLRVDSDVIAWGLRTPQVVSVLVLAASAPLIAYALTRPRTPLPRATPPPVSPPSGRVPVRRQG